MSSGKKEPIYQQNNNLDYITTVSKSESNIYGNEKKLLELADCGSRLGFAAK